MRSWGGGGMLILKITFVTTYILRMKSLNKATVAINAMSLCIKDDKQLKTRMRQPCNRQQIHFYLQA